jgi:hypothetical protein
LVIESKIDSVLEAGENADNDGKAYQANLEADDLEKELVIVKADIVQTKAQLNANQSAK